MRVTIQPGKARGSVLVPSSKSYAHRMVLAAALAEGTSHIGNVSFCDDIAATLDCAAALGVTHKSGGNEIKLQGVGGRFPREAFRQVSYIRAVAVKTIAGHGFEGYCMAMDYLADLLGQKP